MRLPWNSSVKRRSESTRRGPSSDSPAGCSMEPPPKMPQAAGNKTKFRRFAPAQCQSSGKSGLKRLMAANRQAESIDALAEDAAEWLLTLTPQQARRKAG